MTIGPIAWTVSRPVSPLDSIAIVKERLLREKFLVVKDDESFVGILTITDIIAKPHLLVGDCIRPKPRVDYCESLESVLQIMDAEEFLFLPVFKDEEFYGTAGYQIIAAALREEKETLQRREELHRGKVVHLEAMRTLSRGISHDFNNLLTLLLGSIEMVVLDPSLSPENRHALDNAVKAALSASELAKKLTCFARHGTLVKEQSDICTFIEETARFIAQGSTLTVNVDFSQDVRDVYFNGDELSRVVNNLVINAIQAVENQGGGTLTLSGEKVYLKKLPGQPVRPGQYFAISFADTGPGIDEAHLPYIFNPDYTTKPAGNGLGLAIVYSIVSDHGGYVTARSKPNEGTVFHIFLPCTPVSQ